jgi:hypothetical protein
MMSKQPIIPRSELVRTSRALPLQHPKQTFDDVD